MNEIECDEFTIRRLQREYRTSCEEVPAEKFVLGTVRIIKAMREVEDTAFSLLGITGSSTLDEALEIAGAARTVGALHMNPMLSIVERVQERVSILDAVCDLHLALVGLVMAFDVVDLDEAIERAEHRFPHWLESWAGSRDTHRCAPLVRPKYR